MTQMEYSKKEKSELRQKIEPMLKLTFTTLLFFVVSFSLLCQLFPATSFAETIEDDNISIDTTNFSQELVDFIKKSDFDINKDGILSSEERNLVQEIVLFDHRYRDLKGLSYFKKLTSIRISISSSNNIKFSDYLKLSSLKVSGGNVVELGYLPLLQDLSIIGNSEETQKERKLDLTGLPNLRKINLNAVRFEQLDLSKNIELESFNSSSSQVDPNYTQLRNLDFSNSPKLKQISISFSSVKTLNIDSNLQLEYFSLSDTRPKLIMESISDYPNLKSFSVMSLTDTDITSILSSGSQSLQTLYVMQTLLSNLDGRKFPNVTELGFGSNSLPFFNFEEFDKVTRSIQNGDQDIDVLGAKYKDNIYINMLDIVGNIKNVNRIFNLADLNYQTGMVIVPYQENYILKYGYDLKKETTIISPSKTMSVSANLKIVPGIKASASKGGRITNEGITPIEKGGTPTYTIIPDAGYAIDRVTLDGKEVSLTNANTYTFEPIQSDHQLEASFRLLPVVTASATVGGQVNPIGTTSYPVGSAATYTIKFDEGYRIKDVLVDGKKVDLTESTFTFTDLQTNHTLAVSFEEKPKVVKIESPTQLARSLTEIESYLADHPTETMESYVLNQLNPKGSYTFEGETTSYEVPVTLTFLPGSLTQPIGVGTYGGVLTLDPTVWSGEALTQPIQLIVTERTLPPVDPTPPVEPGNPIGPTNPSQPDSPVPPTEGSSEGKNSGTTDLPQTGEQGNLIELVELVMVGLIGFSWLYKKKHTKH